MWIVSIKDRSGCIFGQSYGVDSWVVVYVDDLPIFGSSTKIHSATKGCVVRKFSLKDYEKSVDICWNIRVYDIMEEDWHYDKQNPFALCWRNWRWYIVSLF